MRYRWLAIPRPLALAIVAAVERHDGDVADVEDLIDVWRRVLRVNGERADRIRAQATRLLTTVDGRDEDEL